MLQKVTILNEVDPFDFKNSLLSAIQKIGLENELRNDVFHWTRERDFFDLDVSCWVDKEPMDYLRKAQVGMIIASKILGTPSSLVDGRISTVFGPLNDTYMYQVL